MIAIIDYGMGNIHSVRKALESAGAEVSVTNKTGDIEKCDKVVLPGVGAFGDAARELDETGLSGALRQAVQEKKIFLGICLGLQLLYDFSEESLNAAGLGILKGAVRKFKPGQDLKVPHMGWNQLRKRAECPLLKDVPDEADVYFCHSYYVDPEERETAAGVTRYGLDFASLVWKNNIYGVQFHPEKSQKTGLRIIKNFVNL
ncbi:MAG: imidazole glycerol phosphate synthase subunit HisH [Candidatus Omnitrophica bacterium]|nr:imidazole glycerol phosphate synthase subunit HisH [Candidatus Omnitrophota bacterium]